MKMHGSVNACQAHIFKIIPKQRPEQASWSIHSSKIIMSDCKYSHNLHKIEKG